MIGKSAKIYYLVCGLLDIRFLFFVYFVNYHISYFLEISVIDE